VLHSWFNYQKWKKRNNKLSNDKIILLSKLPNWIWDNIKEQIWYEKKQKVIEYVQLHGEIPLGNVEKEGSWVKHQRTRYKKGILSQKKINLLEQIPKWSWNTLIDQWYDKFNQTKKYIKDNGKLPPTRYPIIGYWVQDQRIRYAEGKLSQERIDLLNSISIWTWTFKKDKWLENFNLLKEYITINNKLPPTRTPIIGSLITGSREAKKNNKISEERINLLESLSHWSW